jgi:hypothetical protein
MSRAPATVTTGVLRHVAALWRGDRAMLLPLAGLLLFLPQYAVLLLIPPMPASAPGGTMETWSRALEPWVARYGAWYVVAHFVAQYGALAIVSLYAHPPLALGGAMARAARLFPRSLLATMLVTLPLGVAALLSLGAAVAPFIVLPGIVYVLARTVLTGAIIVGEPGTGAVAAIGRSWRLTRGHALAITFLVGAVLLGGQALGTMVVIVDRALRAGSLANPVLLAMVDAVAAGVTGAAGLVLALVQVVLYRRLAR